MGRLLFLVATLCAAVATATATAAAPQAASGTWETLSAVPTSIEQKGQNCFIHIAGVVGLQGTLDGETALPDVVFISHAPCGFPGRINAHAHGTFTGTIAGVPTTCAVVVSGTIEATGEFRANSTFRQCTSGQHANLKFVGTVFGVVGTGTYEGQAH
jgi:hypothetical protein